MRAVRVFGGTLLVVAGVWLVATEVGMALSESHALRGGSIAVFAFFILAGVASAYAGIRLLRRR